MLLRTDEGGQPVAVSGGPSAVLSYTAFGEPVWADPNGVAQVGFPPAGFGTRYQYAGGWGYETGLPSGDGGFRGGLAAGSPSRFVWDTTAAGPGELGRGPGSSQGLGSPEGGWAEFAAGRGRPDEFRLPDDLLGLAGVNPTLPPLRLLHVGWRWYDPALGRFVQRDPSGLVAGLNEYLYSAAHPVGFVDPTGELYVIGDLKRFIRGDTAVHEWVARNFWLRFHRPEYLDSPWATAEAVALSVAGGIGGYYCVRPLVPHIPKAWTPWLGKLELHGAHHGLGRHIEIIIRWIGGRNVKVIFPGKRGWPWAGIR
jgi:RHS repeat-associated protein